VDRYWLDSLSVSVEYFFWYALLSDHVRCISFLLNRIVNSHHVDFAKVVGVKCNPFQLKS